MKIGIMTWFQYHNYGTSLQVVAMNKVLKKIGHETSVINYEDTNSPIFLHKNNILHDGYIELKKRIKTHPYHRYEETKREEKFDQFLHDNLNFTEKVNLLPEFKKLNNDFDAFVCGSDQIWSPSFFNPRYFLDFVNENHRKIAYAPSLGTNKIDDQITKAQITKYTKRFEYISTREKIGSKIISELIGRPVETVLDPTFLLTARDWEDIASNFSDNYSPYMLVYMLGTNEEYWSNIYKMAKQLNLQVKVIPVFFKDLKREGCIKEPIGPNDFLSLIKNSDFVCTDSFHGLIFSINFKKEFIIFERFKSNDQTNQNSRIYNSLDMFGLKNRLYVDVNNEYKKIDYSKVESILNVERNKSMNYLIESLNNVYKNKKVCKNNISCMDVMCCGCGACEVVCPTKAISIEMNSYGFYKSNLDVNKCVSCGKCINVCPYNNLKSCVELKNSKLYSYCDNDKKVLEKSSSGGLAYRLSNNAILNGYSVYGCSFESSEHKAKHIIINTIDKIELLQGSKYMQSDFSTNLLNLHNLKSPCIVIGTPCQIAGAKSILKNSDSTIFIDLICHGVPSYNLYKKYLAYLKDEGFEINDELYTIFRLKTKGWRKKYIFNTDGIHTYCKSQNKDPYYIAFEHGFCYSKDCFECPWRDKSMADIRLGDYWHDKYKNNKSGVSMAVTFTKKGEDYLNANINNLKNEPINDYYECQQIKNKRLPVFWDNLQDDLARDFSLSYIIDKYFLPFENRKKIRKVLQALKGFRR